MKEVQMFSVDVYNKVGDNYYFSTEPLHVKAKTSWDAMEKTLASVPKDAIVFCGEGEPWKWKAYEEDKRKDE